MAAKGAFGAVLLVLSLWAAAALSDELTDTTLLSQQQLTGTTLPIGKSCNTILHLLTGSELWCRVQILAGPEHNRHLW